MVSQYQELLEDRNVQRWYDNVSRGSIITADIYLRRLGKFCRDNRMSPADLPSAGAKGAYHVLLDLLSAMEKEGKAGSYAASIVKALKSWLAFNDVTINRPLRIRGARDTPTLHAERVPTQDELRRILFGADHKTGVICLLMAHTGLRPQVLGNYRGSDGLVMGDLPELTIRQGKVDFDAIPALVRVRRCLSKAGHEYFSFLSAEGCERVSAYLERRIEGGETISEASPVVRPKTARKEFITTQNIGDAVRVAIRGAGMPWRPYVLRSYFATQMMLAESKGLLIRDYRTFFMGHKGDIEAVYTLKKRHLPREVSEEMRASYARASRYLEAAADGHRRGDLAEALKRQLLGVAGYAPEEISDEHLRLDDEGFQKLIRDKLLGESRDPQTSQRVVPSTDIDQALRDGWEFVSVLPDGRAVVTRRESA